MQTVIDELYGSLWATSEFQLPVEDWVSSWVAFSGPVMAGVARTSGDLLDDLWILPQYRGHGMGTQLLAHAEEEIGRRGHRQARLRVVNSNYGAIQFYSRCGWGSQGETPHEHLPVTMLLMSKTLL